jgi:hypothetical protein
MIPIAGPKMDLPVKRDQTIYIFVDSKNDIAARTAIPPIGSTQGNVLFTAETNHSIAAVAAADQNFCLIKKHG